MINAVQFIFAISQYIHFNSFIFRAYNPIFFDTKFFVYMLFYSNIFPVCAKRQHFCHKIRSSLYALLSYLVAITNHRHIGNEIIVIVKVNPYLRKDLALLAFQEIANYPAQISLYDYMFSIVRAHIILYAVYLLCFDIISQCVHYVHSFPHFILYYTKQESPALKETFLYKKHTKRAAPVGTTLSSTVYADSGALQAVNLQR